MRESIKQPISRTLCSSMGPKVCVETQLQPSITSRHTTSMQSPAYANIWLSITRQAGLIDTPQLAVTTGHSTTHNWLQADEPLQPVSTARASITHILAAVWWQSLHIESTHCKVPDMDYLCYAGSCLHPNLLCGSLLLCTLWVQMIHGPHPHAHGPPQAHIQTKSQPLTFDADQAKRAQLVAAYTLAASKHLQLCSCGL